MAAAGGPPLPDFSASLTASQISTDKRRDTLNDQQKPEVPGAGAFLICAAPSRRRRAGSEPPAAAPGCGQPISYAISNPAISCDKLLG